MNKSWDQVIKKLTFIQTYFKNVGGFKSKRVWVAILVFLWAFYKFCKEMGWLPKKSVKDKHVFITGAGSGLGRIMALKFVKLGSKITICDINTKGL